MPVCRTCHGQGKVDRQLRGFTRSFRVICPKCDGACYRIEWENFSLDLAAPEPWPVATQQQPTPPIPPADTGLVHGPVVWSRMLSAEEIRAIEEYGRAPLEHFIAEPDRLPDGPPHPQPIRSEVVRLIEDCRLEAESRRRYEQRRAELLRVFHATNLSQRNGGEK